MLILTSVLYSGSQQADCTWRVEAYLIKNEKGYSCNHQAPPGLTCVKAESKNFTGQISELF